MTTDPYNVNPDAKVYSRSTIYFWRSYRQTDIQTESWDGLALCPFYLFYTKHAQNSENAVRLEILIQLAAGETEHVWLVLFIRKSGSCQRDVETSAKFAW